MNEGLKLYEVSNHTCSLHIYATDSAKAKREYCKRRGLRASDPWTGVSSLKARALTPTERAAWEADAEARRDTFVFIRGMMDLSVKAHEEKE